jgi:quinolinate synthase
LNADANAIAAPSISDTTATVPDAEAKCSIAANITADELLGCTDAAMTEATIGTLPHNATFA